MWIILEKDDSQEMLKPYVSKNKTKYFRNRLLLTGGFRVSLSLVWRPLKG